MLLILGVCVAAGSWGARRWGQDPSVFADEVLDYDQHFCVEKNGTAANFEYSDVAQWKIDQFFQRPPIFTLIFHRDTEFGKDGRKSRSSLLKG